MNFKHLLLSFILLATSVTLFTSCEKDEEENNSASSFVGYWNANESMWIGDFEVTIKNTLHLTETSFDMLSQMQTGTTLFKIAGDLSSTDTELTITPTSIFVPNDETGELEEIKKGDEEWAAALEDMEMQDSETFAYSVNGDVLTLTFTGDDPVVFTRQLD